MEGDQGGERKKKGGGGGREGGGGGIKEDGREKEKILTEVKERDGRGSVRQENRQENVCVCQVRGGGG